MGNKVRNDLDPLLNVNDVAEKLNCGVSTVWRYAAEGKLPPPLQIGQMRRWSTNQIEKFLESPAVRKRR